MIEFQQYKLKDKDTADNRPDSAWHRGIFLGDSTRQKRERLDLIA